MKKLIKLLGKIAPTIATGLGGPFAGMATKALTEALGIAPDSDEDQISLAIANDPESLFRLKEMEFDYKKSLDDKGIKIEELKHKDTASARRMRVSLKDPTPTILAIIIMLLFGATLYQVIVVGVATEDKMLVGALIGALTTSFTGIVAFFYGSSAGSRKKTDLLGKKED